LTSISRRDFLRTATVTTAIGSFLPSAVLAALQKPTVYAVHGIDIPTMIRAGISRVGGWKSFVRKGTKVTIKPNAAWASRPEQGGNTDPILVRECVAACRKCGASEVVVPGNPCANPTYSFSISGIQAAVENAGGRMYAAVKDDHFTRVSLPAARNLKQADVVKDVLDTGCLVNMPVAKSHVGAVLTLSMKNWMGSVKDRKVWHRNNLHQCIADFSAFIRPSLIIMDATRIMLTGGPRGPGELSHSNQLIFGVDPVAVDAYAATLFNKEPFDVPYIRIANRMDVGCGDLKKVSVVHVNA